MRPRALICAAFFSVAAQFATDSAQAQISNWPDDGGVLMRSDPLPSDRRGLGQLQATGDASLTAVEKRTLEIINEYAQETSGEALSAAVPAPGSSSLPTTSAGENASASVSLDPATENARDPCLVSWDPKCSEKHAQDYHPVWGYAPSVLRSSR
jgi:hypothetical protein